MSKTKKTTSKKEIQGKAIGRNVILVIDGNKYTKVVADKGTRLSILEKVEAYNKRNSLRKEKEILNIMLENKTTEVERKKEAKKATKKIKTKKPKTAPVSKSEIEAAKKLLEEDGYTVSKQAPKQASTPRQRSGREY